VPARELLKQYVFLHNYGIENADFEPLMQIFDDNIVFAFEDPRIGVFEGIKAVRNVFRLQPPAMPIAVSEVIESGGRASADYADEMNPTARLGTISVDTSGGKITKIFIGK
jgi:hypothetical protein